MNYINGMGEQQIKQMISSRRTIAKFLSDGKPHQFNELKKESRLSAPTISKRLKELIKMDLVTKEVDTKSGKYPYPVFYTATKEFVEAGVNRRIIDDLSNAIDTYIARDKDPFALLININVISEITLENILLSLKKNKNLTKEELFFYWNNWVLEPYKELTLKLLEESMKVIDDINIERCQKAKYEAMQSATSKMLK
jgi:predicted transcriptional regulator